jgi:hypothetical protein
MNIFRKKEGQVMILSVIILGGVLLSAGAIAGLLTVYQIRSSNDAVNSAKAVFAADAGVEIASWCLFKDCSPYDSDNLPPVDFTDVGVYFEATSTVTASEISIVSRGFAADGRVVRILENSFVIE